MRPAKVYPTLASLSPLKTDRVKDVDMMIVRELLGGVYFGEHKYTDTAASDLMEYTSDQIKPSMKFAFEAAMKRNKKVTVVDKANVLDCSRLWRKVANDTASDYPAVELEFMYVDNASMQLILNPSKFDVLVTENLFGDILSDTASVIPGSLGLMPSASLSNSTLHMYEPSGGSAPDIANQNVANPIAQILSASLMLRYSFDLNLEATLIDTAVEQVLSEGILTKDLIPKGESIEPVGTEEMGDAIANKLSLLVQKS